MVIILVPLLPKCQLLVTLSLEIPKKENGVVLFALHAIAVFSSVSSDTKTRSPLMSEYSSVCLPKIGHSDIIECLIEFSPCGISHHSQTKDTLTSNPV